VAVGVRVKSQLWPIGASDFFHAFFSTISYHLEPDGWGSRFPTLMNQLYQGELPAGAAGRGLQELEQARDELKRFPPDAVIWDIENLEAKPPWGDEISEEITDLSNYFVTEDGRQLFDMLHEALSYADRAEAPARIW
jgi:2,3-bisphosphoglycerate-dependent phosphoglycerate mutase